MRRAHLIGFCLAFIGAYGILYAMHAGRSATNPVYELTSSIDENASKVSDLESEIEDIKSKVSNLESEIEDIKSNVEELKYRR